MTTFHVPCSCIVHTVCVSDRDVGYCHSEAKEAYAYEVALKSRSQRIDDLGEALDLGLVVVAVADAVRPGGEVRDGEEERAHEAAEDEGDDPAEDDLGEDEVVDAAAALQQPAEVTWEG